MARTINPDKLRLSLLMTLDFEQSDPKIVGAAKQAIRAADATALIATFEAADPDAAYFETIRDTYKATGAEAEDVTALCKLMAFQGVM